jgi:hypothetical protein
VFTACVVEMLTRGKQFHSLGPGSTGELQKPWMKALVQK